MFSLLLMAAAQQPTQAPGALITPQLPAAFSVAPIVSDTIRLSLSPKIDGKIQTEEWDAFAANPIESFQQWEPGKVHAAARVPMGQDLLVSFDLRGDGWLQGNDNVEVRVKWNGTAPELTARRLDATRPEGPTWVDAPSIAGSSKVAAAVEGDKWVAELSLTDPGLALIPTKADAPIGMRFDAIAPTEAVAEAYLPRALGMVTLSMDRGANLPTGFKWAPEFKGRSVVPGESFRIRLTFNGTDMLDFKRIDMRTEGLAQNETNSLGLPFPAFDRKSRAFVDYETNVTPEAETGWRILRGTLTDGAGRTTIVQTCYEIGSLVQFDFEMPKKLQSSSEPQTLRLATFVRSNTKKRVNGVFRVGKSDVFSIDNGSDKPFVIYNARGSKRQVFEITIPGGFKGALPVDLIAEVGAQTYEQRVWLEIP